MIPKGIAVLLHSETPRLYQLVKSDDNKTYSASDNCLFGSATAKELNGADADYYLLTSHQGEAAFKHVGNEKKP